MELEGIPAMNNSAQCGIASLEDILAIEEQALDQSNCPASTYEIIRNAATRFGERVAVRYLSTGAIVEKPLELHYIELLEMVHRAANLFTHFGIKRQGVVAFVLPNLPQTLACLFGGEAAAIVNPINPLFEGEVIADIAEEAGAEILVTLGPSMAGGLWEKVEPRLGRLSRLKAVLQVNSPGAPHDGSAPLGFTSHGVPIYDFDAAMACHPGERLLACPPGPSDIAAYFHTGGTTGLPKLAMHSHRNQAAQAFIVHQLLDLTEQDVAFGGLPLFHINALFSAGLLNFMVGGSVIIGTPQGFCNTEVIKNFWKLVERYRVTWFSAVPTICTALLSVPHGDTDLDSLRLAVVGAAPMPPEVLHSFRQLLDTEVIEGYGLTEATCISTLLPLRGEQRAGSVGLRIPYQEIKAVILDQDYRIVRDCALGEAGVIVVRGPNVFMGYKQSERNHGVLLADGWLNTGDLGLQDTDGYFHLTGREKDLIIRGGHNIEPAVIENALSSHPAIALAAAVGQPDAYAGELPCVYVALKPGATATQEELLEYAAIHVGEYAAVPVSLDVLEQLPLTAVGKIYKPALRGMAIERVLKLALGEAGILAQVDARLDPARGLVAHVITAQDWDQTRRVLDHFALPYHIEEA